MEINIARVLINTNTEDKKQSKDLLPNCQFNPVVMIDMFPGPALLVDIDMQVKYHNDYATGLLDLLHEKEVFLNSLISSCLSNGCPDTQKATLEDDSGLHHYDLYALPMEPNGKNDPPLVFLFGRETTIEHNLTNALVESRKMFKDLVGCSTDFAWETDKAGNFIYTSESGILGYTSFELNGKNSNDMIIGDDGKNPFGTLDKINDLELWLKTVEGTVACLLVSAVPVLDNEGAWQGARGVCRDITHIREREAVLRRNFKQEQVLNTIVSTIRNMVAPSDMLQSALDAAMEGIQTDFCCVLQKSLDTNNKLTADIKHQQGNLPDPNLMYHLTKRAIDFWQYTDNKASNIKIFHIGQHLVLMGITNHHSEDNGAICLVRNRGVEWQNEEIQLFEGITNHLGIAIEQGITHEELERRASTDELTNLLNRRTFSEAVTKRIKNQKRNHKAGALLFLDLDNFKNVNDTRGHAHGDMVLKELAQIISDNIRVGDYCARLGGDEFAIWLDEIPESEALNKAQSFIQAGNKLPQLVKIEGPQLSISIGIAISQPDGEKSLEDLMENADTALYQAKASGKGSYKLYNPDTIDLSEDLLLRTTRKQGDTNV